MSKELRVEVAKEKNYNEDVGVGGKTIAKAIPNNSKVTFHQQIKENVSSTTKGLVKDHIT